VNETQNDQLGHRSSEVMVANKLTLFTVFPNSTGGAAGSPQSEARGFVNSGTVALFRNLTVRLHPIAALLMAWSCGGTTPLAQTPNTLAITDVAVIDVTTGLTRPNQNVLVSGNRIAAVGPAARVRVPPGATTVNGSGRYLMPGMWDLHSHALLLALRRSSSISPRA
jgi:hypothetical protein